MKRRHLLRLLPPIAVPVAWAQSPPRLRRVPRAEQDEVHVGAGTQDGATTGSSGPQKTDDRSGAAAGTLGSTQSGGGAAGAGSARPGAKGQRR